MARKINNSRNCSIMTHVGQNLVSFSRWRQQLERSIHFASLLHVWWERSSGTWHDALNVNRTTWHRGPFRWSFPPHKSDNKGQKHIAAHALRACSARSLSAYALRSSNHSSGSNNTNSGARNTGLSLHTNQSTKDRNISLRMLRMLRSLAQRLRASLL